MKKTCALISIMAFSPLAADAQRDSVTVLNPIVVTGTGTHRRMADSPLPVQVITARDLAQTNAATLEDALLKLAPNLSIFTNGMGTTLSLNGMSEDYVLILENGRRLAGDNRYTRLNVANIKRIEILNGAASALYGSDAIGGVINIITDDNRNQLDIESYTHVSTHGRLTENANAHISAGRFTSRTSYQRRQQGSWQNNGTDEDGYETDKPTSMGFYQDNINQRFEWRTTDKVTLHLYGDWFDNQTRRPQDALYYSSGKQRQAYTYNVRHETYNYGAGMKWKISPKAYLDAEVFSDNFTSSYRYFAASGSYEPGDEVKRKRTHYYNGSVKGIFRLGSWNKLSAGAEVVNEQLKSESDNISFRDMYSLSLFAQDELRLSRHWDGVVGLRYVWNENFGSYATPSASLMYRLGGLNVRANYSAGYRTPTLSQLYATDIAKTSNRYTMSNPDLDPEKSHFVQLNAEYAWRCLSVSATASLNRVRDMINYYTLSDEEIAARSDAGELTQYDVVRQRSNIDKARTRSLAFNATWRVGWGLTLGGGYTLTDSRAKERQTDGSWERSPIDKSIKHLGNISGQWERTWKFYRLGISVQGRLQGKRYSQSYGYAPKYQQWDLNTRHTFTLASVTLEPGLGIENIFDQKDRRPWNNNFSSLSPGRAVYGSLLVRFHK